MIVQIDDHRKEALPYVIPQIADCLLLTEDQVLDVLETWTTEQLIEHLEKHTRAELMPPHLRNV